MQKRSEVLVAVCCAVMLSAAAVAQTCPGDLNGDRQVTIDELVSAVNAALNGCDGASVTRSPTPIRTPTRVRTPTGTVPPAPSHTPTSTPQPPRRFVDNSDGTITDRETGLMWEKKVALNGVPGGPHDADNEYRWSGMCSPLTFPTKLCQPDTASAAACATAVDGDPVACARCSGRGETCLASPGGTSNFTTVWGWVAELNSGNGFAGHRDWRVPTLDELIGINDARNYTFSPFIEDSGTFSTEACATGCGDLLSSTCSCTHPGFHWSSTTLEHTEAWLVYPGAPNPSATYHTQYSVPAQVRAVRGGR